MIRAKKFPVDIYLFEPMDFDSLLPLLYIRYGKRNVRHKTACSSTSDNHNISPFLLCCVTHIRYPIQTRSLVRRKDAFVHACTSPHERLKNRFCSSPFNHCIGICFFSQPLSCLSSAYAYDVVSTGSIIVRKRCTIRPWTSSYQNRCFCLFTLSFSHTCPLRLITRIE